MSFPATLGLAFWALILVMVSSAAVPPAQAGEANWEKKWTALTIAANGSWGVGIQRHKHAARLGAVRSCKARSAGREDDCGERVVTIEGGWSLAYRCGNYPFAVAEVSLEQAKVAARYRETRMRFVRRLQMPKCELVVTVGPVGTVEAKVGM